MRSSWWQVLPFLAVSEDPSEIVQLPWSPEPPRYRVPVASNMTPETLSLYKAGMAVDVDVGDTFLQRLSMPAKGDTKWTIVEIYDYTCPHCWYAVPIYMHVAEAYADNPRIQFTSINCHLSYNMEVCFLLENIGRVKDFPTFLACPPHETVDADVQLRHSHPAQVMAKRLPPNHPTRLALLKMAHCRHKFVEEDAKSGLEDPYLSATQLADWVHATTGEKALLPADLNIGANFHRKMPVSAIAPPGRPGWLRDDEEGRPGVSRYFPGERWYDALMGFVAFVYQGYQPTKLQPTLEVTRYLSMAFPVKGKELAKLADSLERRGSDILPSEARQVIANWSIDVGLGDPEYEAGDDVAKQEHINGLVKRTSRSSSDHRGGRKGTLQSLTCPQSSTCNLWNLLHVTLAAVAARGFSGRTLLGDGSILSHGSEGGMALRYQDPEIGVREAQAFVRTFVDNFLNCKQCRERFIWDYDQCNYGRCDYKDWQSLPLWLWRVHNAVSLHVASHRGSPVDRRWPEYQDCPRCWREDLVLGKPVRLLSEHPGVDAYDLQARSESRWSSQELDMPFNLKAVYWHLVSTFVGVKRIVFSIEDFAGHERGEVQHVLTKEGVHTGASPAPRPPAHDGQVVQPAPGSPPFNGGTVPLQPFQPSESSHSAQSIFLALLAMACGVAIVICYFGQDTMDGPLDVEDLEDRDFGREARAPMFRAGANSQSQARDAEVELVKDNSAAIGDEQAADAAE
ncbi:QSOX1 [Symbiodinium sp. CCMP2592]|nr:QSOX1 [Symbiodinium sp. CCMP2592]